MSGVRWAAIAAAAALVACGSTKVCTAMGCPYADSAVIVTVPESSDLEGSEVTVCVDGVCDLPTPFADAQAVPDGTFVFVVPGADDGDEVVVTVEQPDGKLTGTGTMESSQPNGEGCGPPCIHAEVSLEG